MTDIEEQKLKLQQKKARVAMEETKLKLKERKARTRHLIEIGGLITRAGLDHLPSNALYGGLLSLKKELDNNENIVSGWIVRGNSAFNKEKEEKKAVICKFPCQPEKEIRDFIRSLGLRFNKFRSEWYGHVNNPDDLKKKLATTEHELEVIQD